jgi:serine/threonine protein kinase/tetratricopeptide (TPR) repeat protein
VTDEDVPVKARVCRTCNKQFRTGDSVTCPDDGGTIVDAQKDPLIGQIFAEKYEIIDVLGEGGMSIVYKARHRHMDRIVAVKLLLEHLVADKTALARFEHESKAASSLSHQNIVTVHDFGMTKTGQAYFVMDCLEGETLAEVLERKKRLPLQDALNIFKQTCDGLHHAHKKGVVHRDLKPSNLVLMTQDDASTLVKIVDFGIAKLLPKDGKPRQNITQTGEIVGSPLYMSPEQCNGKSMDHRSDIYSLGCLMYETLAGEPPLMGDTFVNTVVKHINVPPPPFSETAPDAGIPAQVEACILKCLAKNPDERYQSAAEVRQSLLDAALEAGVKGLRPGAVPEPTKGHRKNDFLRKTFDRVKLSGPQAAHPLLKRDRNLLLAVSGTLVLLLGALVTLALWPGPEGDRGLNFLRFMWQYDLSQAQEALKKEKFEEARDLLLDAKRIATSFEDRHKKMLETLTLLSGAYGKCGMYSDQETTNQQIDALNTQEAREDEASCEQLLANLQSAPRSAAPAMQLEAEANADKILSCAKKLLARSLFGEAEKLLVHAINTFDQLKLSNNQKFSEFKMYLAECLMLQQRLPEVRPLLAQALKIRQDAPDLAQNPRSQRNLVKAYLKLGQFDRDQSNFKESREELWKGLQLAQSKFSYDNELMAEALNSYGDLLRQTGEPAHAREFLKKADEVSKNLPQHARTMRSADLHSGKTAPRRPRSQ